MFKVFYTILLRVYQSALLHANNPTVELNWLWDNHIEYEHHETISSALLASSSRKSRNTKFKPFFKSDDISVFALDVLHKTPPLEIVSLSVGLLFFVEIHMSCNFK